MLTLMLLAMARDGNSLLGVLPSSRKVYAVMDLDACLLQLRAVTIFRGFLSQKVSLKRSVSLTLDKISKL